LLILSHVSLEEDDVSLQDVMLEELRDLYSAENQLLKALPKLAKAAEDQDLKQAFTNHLEQTRGHVERLKKVFELLDEKPTGKHCNGMKGLIEEGQEAIDEDEEGSLYDIGLIGAAARVEHYEIAGYTAVIAMARGLGLTKISQYLDANVGEEDATRGLLEKKLEELIEQNPSEPGVEEEDDEEKPPARKESKSASASKAAAKKRAR
jgi:ferritin-like metal-binding protein YciE